MSSTNATQLLFIALLLAVALIALLMVVDSRRKSVSEPAMQTPALDSPPLKAREGLRAPARPITTSEPGATPKSKPLTVAELTPPAAAWTPSKFVAIDLSAAANRNFLAEIKRASHGAEGIPNDGHVPIPGVVPRAFFQLGALDADNAILLIERKIVPLAEKNRGKYRQVAFLHGGQDNGGAVRALLHYATGEDQSLQLQLLNWTTKTRREKLESREYAAVQTLGTDGRINMELFSQTFSVDSARVLESIIFEPNASAAIFGVTVIPADDPAANP